MHGFCRVHGERHARREDAAHHCQQQPLLQVKVFGFDAHLALFQLSRAGDDTHAYHRNKHAKQRHLPAFGVDQHVDIAVKNGRHQRADDERNANCDANTHRHPEVAHGQAVIDVADAPHRPEQKHWQEGGGTEGSKVAPEIREQHGANGPRQNQPGHGTAN